jgi:glycosyltransferase involved in cell wall biosynthesis
MRILVVSERLSDNDDDGIKNIALAFLREGRRSGHEMSGFSEWTAIPELNIRLIKTNRWYSDARLKDQVRSINPDMIVYVPWTSATARSLVRLSNLKRFAGGASTIIVATQPMPYRWFERLIIPFAKPDLAVVMSPTTEQILTHQGIRTWFMPAGYYPERCYPQPDLREQLRERYNLPLDKTIVSHVGHLKRERIAPEFLEKLNRSRPEWLFLWVGSPHTPAEEDYLLEIEKLPGVRVLRSYIDNIADVYNLSDVYLFPVADQFACVGVPLSIIEAAACNRPIVSVPFQGVDKVFEERDGFAWAHQPQEFVDQVEKCLQIEQVKTGRFVEQLAWDKLIAAALEQVHHA